MRRALILDTETTGLDPKKDKVIEVGVVLYDLELAAPIVSYATLFPCAENPAENTNRISPRLTTQLPDEVLSGLGWEPVVRLGDCADVILAHRVEFDRQFVPHHEDRPWVCTKFHVEWPLGKPGESLVQLALEHGVGVVHAHRALTDCDILARLLTRVHEMGISLPSLITRAMRPRVKVKALVSYAEREKAKVAGFAWDAEAKHWWREVVVDEIDKLPFKTKPL